MVEYASGSIHFSGLGSDTDFTDMMEKLYAIEGRQAKQLMRWRADWKKRLEGFQQIRSELLNMQTALSALNSVDKFLAKSASSSKDTVAVATASGSAMQGTYNLTVNQLASTSIWSADTGLYQKTDVINDTGDGDITYTYKGKTRTVNVPKNTTIDGLKNLINNDSKNLGVKAQLIQTTDGIVFQLRGMDTGKEAELVINGTTNLNRLGVTLDTKYTISDSTLSLTQTTFASGADVINTDAATKTFVYSYDGSRYTIDVPQGMTLQGLVDAINANGALNSKHPAIASVAVDGGGRSVFTLNGADTPYTYTPTANFTDLLNTQWADINSNVNTTGVDKEYKFDLDGTTITVISPPNQTLMQLKDSITAKIGSKAVTNLVQDSGTNQWVLNVTPTSKVHSITVGEGSLDTFAYSPPTETGGAWLVNYGQNAKVRLNGWPREPEWMESSSNALTSVAEGMTFNLRAVGDTTITVGIDTEKIAENMQKFVDAVNSFRTVMMSLSNVDKEKEVLDPEYAESQFEMQKGGVLTGNYGMQILTSRLKNAVAGQAVGFNYLQDQGDGYLTGDIFSALSQIGITTNAQEGHVNYGLLEINTVSGFQGSLSFEEALTKDPEGIARLFSAKNEGRSNSSHFEYNSHVVGITKHGTYDVQYTVDGDGNIASATINGKTANIDNEKRQIGLFSGTNDPADGIILDVFDLTPNATFSGNVSIQQGKVNEILSMMDGTEGLLGSGGTVAHLEKNYKSIIDGIDAKIKKEDERLVKWERTMRLRISRLEEVLARYNSINEGLKTQLAQLSSSSS